MKNINLKDKSISDKRKNKISFSLVLSSVVLIIVFLVYGIAFILSSTTQKNVKKVEEEISSTKKYFSSGEFKEVYDFGVNSLDLKERINRKGFLPFTEDIIKISEKTLSEIYFTGLEGEIEENLAHYKIQVITPSNESLAKQIKVYKETEGLKDVFLVNVSKNEETGVLSAELTFDIGEKKVPEVEEKDIVEESF